MQSQGRAGPSRPPGALQGHGGGSNAADTASSIAQQTVQALLERLTQLERYKAHLEKENKQMHQQLQILSGFLNVVATSVRTTENMLFPAAAATATAAEAGAVSQGAPAAPLAAVPSTNSLQTLSGIRRGPSSAAGVAEEPAVVAPGASTSNGAAAGPHTSNGMEPTAATAAAAAAGSSGMLPPSASSVGPGVAAKRAKLDDGVALAMPHSISYPHHMSSNNASLQLTRIRGSSALNRDSVVVYRMELYRGGYFEKFLYLPNDAIPLYGLRVWQHRDAIPNEVIKMVENCLTTKAVHSEQFMEELRMMKAHMLQRCPHLTRWGLGSNKVRLVTKVGLKDLVNRIHRTMQKNSSVPLPAMADPDLDWLDKPDVEQLPVTAWTAPAYARKGSNCDDLGLPLMIQPPVPNPAAAAAAAAAAAEAAAAVAAVAPPSKVGSSAAAGAAAAAPPVQQQMRGGPPAAGGGGVAGGSPALVTAAMPSSSSMAAAALVQQAAAVAAAAAAAASGSPVVTGGTGVTGSPVPGPRGHLGGYPSSRLGGPAAAGTPPPASTSPAAEAAARQHRQLQQQFQHFHQQQQQNQQQQRQNQQHEQQLGGGGDPAGASTGPAAGRQGSGAAANAGGGTSEGGSRGNETPCVGTPRGAGRQRAPSCDDAAVMAEAAAGLAALGGEPRMQQLSAEDSNAEQREGSSVDPAGGHQVGAGAGHRQPQQQQQQLSSADQSSRAQIQEAARNAAAEALAAAAAAAGDPYALACNQSAWLSHMGHYRSAYGSLGFAPHLAHPSPQQQQAALQQLQQHYQAMHQQLTAAASNIGEGQRMDWSN